MKYKNRNIENINQIKQNFLLKMHVCIHISNAYIFENVFPLYNVQNKRLSP